MDNIIRGDSNHSRGGGFNHCIYVVTDFRRGWMRPISWSLSSGRNVHQHGRRSRLCLSAWLFRRRLQLHRYHANSILFYFITSVIKWIREYSSQFGFTSYQQLAPLWQPVACYALCFSDISCWFSTVFVVVPHWLSSAAASRLTSFGAVSRNIPLLYSARTV